MAMASVHSLERLMRVGLDTPFVQNALEKLVQDQIAHEVAELERLRPRLAEYESRFGMTSVEFFERYQGGKIGDEMDYFEWNVLYKMFLDSQQRLGYLRDEA